MIRIDRATRRPRVKEARTGGPAFCSGPADCSEDIRAPIAKCTPKIPPANSQRCTRPVRTAVSLTATLSHYLGSHEGARVSAPCLRSSAIFEGFWAVDQIQPANLFQLTNEGPPPRSLERGRFPPRPVPNLKTVR